MLLTKNMNSKLKKFYSVNQFYDMINTNSYPLSLLVHISNMNIMQSNQIKQFCDNNKISSQYIKINILKKLTKNKLFVNLFAGPTKIFFFKDYTLLSNFMNLVPLKNKIFPLCILYNNYIYNYNFFLGFLKLMNLSQPLSLPISQKQLVSQLSINHNILMKNINFIQIIFIINITKILNHR